MTEHSDTSPTGGLTLSPLPGTDCPISARIWLFGALAALSAERPMTVPLRSEPTAGDAIEAIGQRLGRPFLDQVLSEPAVLFRCCRIFANGHPVNGLDEPLVPDGSAMEIEILLLTGYEGG